MTSTSYWYSTNGRIHLRLSNSHLETLDEAFKQHVPIKFIDQDLFGPNTPITAYPSQGTMTAGDLHYGLYRQPPLWRMSDTELDMLFLEEEPEKSKRRFMRRSHQSNIMDVCCVIS